MASKVGLSNKYKKRKQDADLMNNKKNIEKKYNSKIINSNDNKRRKKNSGGSVNGNSYTVLYETANNRKRKNSNNDDYIPLNGGGNKNNNKNGNKKGHKEVKIDYRKKRKEIKERKKKRREKEKQRRMEIYGDNDSDDYNYNHNINSIDDIDSDDLQSLGIDKNYLYLNNRDSNYNPNKKRKIKDNDKGGEGPVWAPYKRYSGTFEERLHEEILDFVKYITPNKSEINTRLYTIDKLRSELHHRFPDSKVECFGSFSTGLFLPTSDLDIVVYRPGGDKNSASYAANPTQGNQSKNLNKIARYIRSNGFFIHKVIRHSRIPIIKAEDDLTHYHIDISYNQESGVPAINYIKQNIKKYPALKPLVYILKHFLYINDMNEVFTGGLGSFSVVCLVLSYLKFYPKIFYESKDKECVVPENLGTLLVNFLYLFGGGFDYENIGISVSEGTFYRKMDKGFYNFKQRHLLSIEDPIMAGNDLTKGSHRILEIAQAWKQALDQLKQGEEKDLNKIKKNQPSLLAKILYFDYQEIKRRKQIREYIYPKVIKRTGDVYTSISPFASSSEDHDSSSSSDDNVDDDNNNNDNNNNSTNNNNGKVIIEKNGRMMNSSNSSNKIVISSKTNHSTTLDETEDSQVTYDEVATTMKDRRIAEKQLAKQLFGIHSSSEEEEKEDNNNNVNNNNVNNVNNNNKRGIKRGRNSNEDKDDEDYITISTEDEEDDNDDNDEDYIAVSTEDDSDDSDDSSYPPLHEDDEIYIYNNNRTRSQRKQHHQATDDDDSEYIEEDDDDEYDDNDNDDDDDDDYDEEFDEHIAREEDDELDEEEFDSDLYNKLGENFLDEDNIDIDELLYK